MSYADPRLAGFKAYDLRGRVPEELDERLADLIGRAYARFLAPRRVAVGRDMRLSGAALANALIGGLTASGVDVVNIGVVGTEQVYFAAFSLGLDGGIMVTASHNPADYNGMKFVREQAVPISGDTGLFEIRDMVGAALAEAGPSADGPSGKGALGAAARVGSVESVDLTPSYIDHLLTHVDRSRLRPLRIVANAGDGMAGPIIDRLRPHLPFEIIPLFAEPDGSFPRGVPNPLLPEKRAVTAAAVLAEGADLGLAWDGDFDRCFFFDERGQFVEGYYLVGLLAEQALRRRPGAAIVHDPRLIWNTVELVEAAGGRPVMNKSGHAFIKERMRREDAAYGGEMSAHHYFADFSYADSGMVPWLQVAELMCVTGRSLSDLVGERVARYPVSGEINLELADPAGALRGLREYYAAEHPAVDEIDGVSLEFARWRVNVRSSNTEPVLRVNLETRADQALLEERTAEVLALLRRTGSGAAAGPAASQE
ncbi:MAG: phosphohexomutase domain-containing protein [Thermoleophilia bacterium]